MAKRLSTAELRTLYQRRQFLSGFLKTTSLVAQVSPEGAVHQVLRRIRDVRAEVKEISDDPRFDTLVSAPQESTRASGTLSALHTMTNVMVTARELITYVDSMLDLYISPKSAELREDPMKAAKVFIGHGQNEIVRSKVKDFVRDRCHLTPLVLQDLPSSGLTLIEKLEKYGRLADYAVFILTGDDLSSDGGSPRARQNVIQELGWFQGVLGRDRTAMLRQEGVEIASNIAGVVYLGFEGDGIEATFEPLRKEFEEAGLI